MLAVAGFALFLSNVALSLMIQMFSLLISGVKFRY